MQNHFTMPVLETENAINNYNNNMEKTKKYTKNVWSIDEDSKLKDLTDFYGVGSWSLIAQYIPVLKDGKQRTAKQCSERWKTKFNPDVIKGNWSLDEDEWILKMFHEDGNNSWVDITNGLVGRTRNDVRNRLYSLKRTRKYHKRSNGCINAFTEYCDESHERLIKKQKALLTCDDCDSISTTTTSLESRVSITTEDPSSKDWKEDAFIRGNHSSDSFGSVLKNANNSLLMSADKIESSLASSSSQQRQQRLSFESSNIDAFHSQLLSVNRNVPQSSVKNIVIQVIEYPNQFEVVSILLPVSLGCSSNFTGYNTDESWQPMPIAFVGFDGQQSYGYQV